ncbi:hypothetical protein V8E54_012483, partial [Elaphomyces granulatus]
DKRCVISGHVNPENDIADGVWTGFEAAHVFPLALDPLCGSLATTISSRTMSPPE